MQIGNTLIGLKQMKNEPPQWYRNFANAIIIFFLPAFIGTLGVLVKYHMFPEMWFNFTSEMSVYFSGAVKGFQFLLGKKEEVTTLTTTNNANENATSPLGNN